MLPEPVNDLRSFFVASCHVTLLTSNEHSSHMFARSSNTYRQSGHQHTYIYIINEIESVQRTFTERLPGLDQFTYAERLHHLKLQSLEHRRLLSDLILCFKIVRGFSSITINDMFIPSTNLFLRGHSFRLEIPLAKCNIRNHFFACRVIRIWNSLPDAVVSAPTVQSFKVLIKKIDLS